MVDESKIFKYRGKTLEELQALSFDDFVAMLPASLRRKVKRGFTEEEVKVMKQIEAGKKNLKTHCRDLFVTPQMVGLRLSIHNGKEFVQIPIMEEMIAMRLGELAPTRKSVKHPTSK